MTNRTLYESKKDLVASAAACGVFGKAFIGTPAQISSDELPLMAIEHGSELIGLVGHDPREAEYTGEYDFDVVLAIKSSCLESEVITIRNTFIQQVVADANANKFRPFKLTRLRHFKGDWAEFECWFVTMTFTRVTCEEFNG